MSVVQFGVSIIVFLVSVTDGQMVTLTGPPTVQKGNNTVFTCTLDTGTTTQFVWSEGLVIIFQGGSPFSADPKYDNLQLTSETGTSSIMTIENTAVEDEGAYACSYPSDTSDPIDLVVEVRSSRSLTLSSTVINNVDFYVATCEATGGKPLETITWILDGVTQSDGNGNAIETTNPPATSPLSNTRSVFTFPANLENYGQTLVCEITGHSLTELNGQEYTNLNVHTSPSTAGTIVTADYMYVTQGTGITVSCSAQNEPNPTMRNYYIYSNASLMHESTEEDNDIVISNPEAGTNYTCMAGNYLGNTSISEAVAYDPRRPTTPLSTTEPITTEGTNPDPTGHTTPLTPTEPVQCTCLSSGASAGIAVLAVLLVVSIIINFIQFIVWRRNETKPGFEESQKAVSRELRKSHEANDNMAYEMVQSGDRAYTDLKLGPSGTPRSPIIAPENLTFFTRLGSIGRGDFGGVWKGEIRSNKGQVDVAIRQIPDQVTKSANVLQSVKVLFELSDQLNVVKCLGYCQQQGSILYDFISGGTLLTHLQTTGVQAQPTYGNLKPNKVRMDEGSLLNFAWQIAKGMQFLASKKIVHGTLCAHNVLLTERKQCKLADYGLASSLFSKGGKPSRWSSPETMVSGVHSKEGDIWSFGIVLWEIVTLGARPYPNMTFDIVQKEVTNGYKMPCPRHCGQELYTLMSLCWEKEPGNRSSFEQILKSLERILEKTHNYLSLNDLDEGLYASTLDM